MEILGEDKSMNIIPGVTKVDFVQPDEFIGRVAREVTMEGGESPVGAFVEYFARDLKLLGIDFAADDMCEYKEFGRFSVVRASHDAEGVLTSLILAPERRSKERRALEAMHEQGILDLGKVIENAGEPSSNVHAMHSGFKKRVLDTLSRNGSCRLGDNSLDRGMLERSIEKDVESRRSGAYGIMIKGDLEGGIAEARFVIQPGVGDTSLSSMGMMMRNYGLTEEPSEDDGGSEEE